MSASLEGLAVLVAVWGQRHVAEFLDYALPSWLAPGNLPALAAAAGGQLELLLLTSEADIAVAQQAPAIAALAPHARVQWVPIDDLIAPPAYTTTLTLAFARGVRRREAVAFGAPIVFLNSDFVLADGSLASLARGLAAGARAVLAPSLRAGCRQHPVEILDALARGQQGLARRYEARALVRATLEDLHPTALATLADQGALQSLHANQFLWRLDRDTLLGRSFLMFPLAARPTRRLGAVEGFCDYDLLDRLAPGEPRTVMGDSDAFFAFEAAEPAQQAEFLQVGAAAPAGLARGLGAWLTPQLRAQARHDLVFHAAEVTQRTLADGQVGADRFLDALLTEVQDRPPGPHPYWQASLAFWRERRRILGMSDWAPELGPEVEAPPVPRRERVLRAAKAFLFGGSGAPKRPWQPGFPAARLLQRRLAELEPVLRGGDSDLEELLGPWRPVQGEPRAAILAVAAAQLEAPVPELERLAAALPPSGTLLVLLRAAGREAIGPLDVARLMAALPGFTALESEAAGSGFEGWAARTHARTALRLRQPGLGGKALAMLRSLAALVVLMVAHAWPGPHALETAPAVLLRFRRL